MSLDVPASFAELWKITDATSGDLRPEFTLPLMYSESSLSPSADNGVGFYGINQIDGNTLKAKGIDPADYKTWPASKQLRVIAGPFFKAQNAQYGPIRSGTRLYQANFVPASLPLAHDFADPIVVKGGKRYGGQEGAFYSANASNLDLAHKGAITVGDMAAAISRALAHPTVDGYIAAAYVFRGEPRPGITALPTTLTPENPVYGTDFDSKGNYIGGRPSKAPPAKTPTSGAFPWGPVLLATGMVAAAGAAFWYLEAGGSRKVKRLLEENPTSGRAVSHVQSLLFSRNEFTVARAKAWAREHGYRYGKVDVTAEHIRIRQQDPAHFARLRTVVFNRGIKAVVGFN